jgi:hypothetical protein
LDLAEAIADFDKNAQKNQQFILLGNDLDEEFRDGHAKKSIRHAARTFGNSIAIAIQTIETKTKFKNSKWTSQVGNFLKKIYPVTKLSLGLLQIIGEVNFCSSSLKC